MNSQQSVFQLQIIDGQGERTKFRLLDLLTSILKSKGTITSLILNWLDDFALQEKIFATKIRPSVDYWIAITSETLGEQLVFYHKEYRANKIQKETMDNYFKTLGKILLSAFSF
jgi:hypothetical protein